MAQCPNCGKEFIVEPPGNVRWWQYDPGPRANLGCGTLILIAIIVLVFSGGRGVKSEIEQLQRDVQKVERAVEALGKEQRDRAASAEAEKSN